MRRIFLLPAVAVAVVAALCLALQPASAGERVNANQVLTCLERERSADACEGTLMAPCGHMAKSGFLRACTYRLRVRWQEMLDRDVAALIQVLPRARSAELTARSRQWTRWMAQDCARTGAALDPTMASIRRNRCRIGWIAATWARLVRETPDLYQPLHHRR